MSVSPLAQYSESAGGSTRSWFGSNQMIEWRTSEIGTVGESQRDETPASNADKNRRYKYLYVILDRDKRLKEKGADL